jgi:diguanylate cyclase (GGDEF)-like protein/PAS domain S-box-containing protein
MPLTTDSLDEPTAPVSSDQPLPRWYYAIGVVVAALVVVYYAAMFPWEYRHPIDVVDVFRESANFLGVLAVAIWARHDVRPLNVGFCSVLLSLWMEVVDEFTAEPLWQGTYVPAFFGIAGIALIALGVREARRRRAAEVERRASAEGALRRNASVLRAVVETTPDAVWVKGGDGRYLLANTAFASLVGKSEAAIVGHGEAELFAAEPETRGRAVARALESGAAERFEATVVQEGEARTYLVSRSAFRDESGRAIGVLGIARDISDRKAIEDRLFQQAHHDALTGLANRPAFLERLGRAQSSWRHRPERLFAVLFIDIDYFKDVNDRHGHAVGDELLVAFAEALGRWLRPGDYIARMSGDEFTVLLSEVAGPDDAAGIAVRILEGLREPFMLKPGPLTVAASIGVAMCTVAPESADALVHAADAAMYRAKKLGKARHVMAGAS